MIVDTFDKQFLTNTGQDKSQKWLNANFSLRLTALLYQTLEAKEAETITKGIVLAFLMEEAGQILADFKGHCPEFLENHSDHKGQAPEHNKIYFLLQSHFPTGLRLLALSPHH